MSGRQPGSLEAWKDNLPWDLRGLELGKDPATLGQAYFWWQMGCSGYKYNTKPHHQENRLLHGDANCSTFSMHVMPWASFQVLV